jgi:uncharacterized membrane protein (DUF373 family)
LNKQEYPMKPANLRHINDLFQISLKWIINILILYIILVLAVGLGKTLFSATDLLDGAPFNSGFSHVITDILSFLVILELFRSFIEYFKARRFRLHSMMDPFIIFVGRECLVMLYSHAQMTWQTMLGFSALILSLGAVRTLAVVFSPEDDEPQR